MSAINWSDKYSVSVNALDEQHKKLFDLINKLSDGMKAGKNDDQIGKIFTELIAYTDKHFKEEERLFKQYNYPGTAKHVKEHDDLRAQVMELKAKHDSGSLVVTVQLLNFLVGWVSKHIFSEDKQYSAFFNSKGVH